jgi:hypothetical protein
MACALGGYTVLMALAQVRLIISKQSLLSRRRR